VICETLEAIESIYENKSVTGFDYVAGYGLDPDKVKVVKNLEWF
jgi:hypothetical protein|tara:strand:- start:813 stop:944 length:132 start_codon:yes stop_codon:yes gene_type:complete